MGFKFLYNIFGAGPHYRRCGKAAAGSTETFAVGDMIQYVTGDGRIKKVTAAVDYDKPLAIAAEPQLVGDVARHLNLLIPKQGDVFEVDADAEASLKVGKKVEIVDHETVTACAGGTTYIGTIIGDDQYLPNSTTIMGKTKLQVELTDQTGKEFSD